MKLELLTSGVLVVLLGSGCSTPEKEGTVEKSANAYRNTFDFVWQSSVDELKNAWTIESENRAKRTITTGWNMNLSPFSRHGRRDRIIVTLTGGDGGWRASANQESETNTNEEAPLDPEKAKWSAIPNDGGLASRFLQNLDTRLQPDERWRDRLVR